MADFAVQYRLGEGATGEVYLAQADGRQVALKFLKSGAFSESPDLLKQEVRLLARLSHPNLVQILDFFPSGLKQDRPFFSMEFVPGDSLQDWLGKKDAAAAVSVFQQSLEALHYLHARRVLHRDLKPSNIRVTPAGQVKILDFGLSTLDSASSSVRGTLRYLPPEAFNGDYGAAGDLFSLGAVFYEVLSGKPAYAAPLSAEALSPEPLAGLRPDLPSHVADLIDRMVERSPARRPSSALAALKYLQEHGQGREATLLKAPFVGRRSEMESLETRQKRAAESHSPSFVRIAGPAGVGRSRFLEEAKWNFQIRGITALSVKPKQAADWRGRIAERLGFLRKSGNRDPYSDVRDWIRSAPERPAVLFFEDLQEWEARDLEALRLFLGGLGRSSLPWTVVLEGTDEAPGLSELSETLSLGDLSRDETLELIAAADPEKRISASRAAEIAEASGGRPLLALQALAAGERTKASFEGVCAARVFNLSEPAKRLLAVLCSHVTVVSLIDAAQVFGRDSFEEALLELDEKDFLADRTPEAPILKLAHPALKASFVSILGPEIIADAHARWIALLKDRAASGEANGSLIPLVEHALATRDAGVLRTWGVRATEKLQASGRHWEALDWLEKILPAAATPEERVLVNAHMSPLYFRLGRFQDAVASYDRWFAERVDDETRLQRRKHLYYTGLVYFTWGKPEEAARRLGEAAATEGKNVPGAHRPYITRAHCALAALMEKENRWEVARGHLEKALGFAGDDAVLVGEVEQLFGKIDQRDFQYASAVRHFQQARAHYTRAGDAQAEAAAMHAEGMAQRDAGNLSRAFECVNAAAGSARAHGDVLQWARYLENLGVIFLEAADYGAAKETFEDAQDVLETLARPEDREAVALVRAHFALRVGRPDRCRKVLERLLSQKPFHGPDTRFSLELLTAEMHYARGDYEKSRQVFELAASDFGKHPEAQPIFGLQSLIGVCRCLAARGKLGADLPVFQKTVAFLDALSGEVFDVWKKAFRFFTTPTETISEKDAQELLSLVRRHPQPETRADLYRLLAADLARRGAPTSAADLTTAYENELRAIHQTLPEENRMDFEKTRTFRPVEYAAPNVAAPTHAISEARFKQYSQINRYIAQDRPLDDILERVMDAAIELTGAERGFLLLRSEGAAEGDGPLPGFEVKSARHLSRRGLKQKEFALSLSAVRKAVEGGSYLLTDDAQLDPRLKSQQSVMIHQLKSIFVMPLELEEEAVGVIYLDHPFRQACFSQESVLLLSALASQAALAVQKSRLIAALKASESRLAARVEDQSAKIESMTQELAQMRDQLKYGYEDIVGRSPAILKVFQLLDHVTDTAIPVWIHGESGTGKELIARALHFNSPRKAKPFVAENCSAIPETLLESELFGHKKGAFTHADRDRVGLFEQASGGTLFLDEIADMSMPMQTKLLRVLQEGEIRPLGSSKTVKVDVRLVTASNKNLADLVRQGKFREDLFFRINGLKVDLPPLRQRKEDIPLLAEHFSKKFAEGLKLPSGGLSEGALRLLLQHPWPGNIRELEGVLRTAVLFAKGKQVEPQHLNLNLPSGPSAGTADASKSEEDSAERQMILDALKTANLSKEAAAKKLGMGLRTLYTRMGQLGLPKKRTLLAKYLGL